ncbi:MAG: hypothetical protein Q6351_007010 [Candidatus Njordarchaeum guaymaensis]
MSKKVKSTCKELFGMSAREIAEMIIDIFSPKARWRILEYVLGQGIRIPDIANSCKIPERSLRTAKSRETIGDKLGLKLFSELANKYPHILRFALDKYLDDFSKNRRWLREKLLEREGIIAK